MNRTAVRFFGRMLALSGMRSLRACVFAAVALAICATVWADARVADGDVTGLIDAIDRANAQPDRPAVIQLARNGTYTLEESLDAPFGGPVGVPVIESEITIHANGATIKRSSATGTPRFRIFTVLGLSQALEGQLTLQDAIITGGETPHSGGGIGNAGGRLAIVDSTITGNESGNNGGGIAIGYGGTLRVVNSTIRGNKAPRGGGISASPITATPAPAATVLDGTFSDSSPAFRGGGITIHEPVTISNSVITGNVATERGGGLASSLVTIVTDSILERNFAAESGGGWWSLNDANEVETTILCANIPDPVDGPITDRGGNEFSRLCPETEDYKR